MFLISNHTSTKCNLSLPIITSKEKILWGKEETKCKPKIAISTEKTNEKITERYSLCIISSLLDLSHFVGSNNSLSQLGYPFTVPYEIPVQWSQKIKAASSVSDSLRRFNILSHSFLGTWIRFWAYQLFLIKIFKKWNLSNFKISTPQSKLPPYGKISQGVKFLQAKGLSHVLLIISNWTCIWDVNVVFKDMVPLQVNRASSPHMLFNHMKLLILVLQWLILTSN